MAKRQSVYLRNGHESFPGPDEAAETVWEAVHDGKDQINYPSDHICRELYDQYNEMGMEKFKAYFSTVIYGDLQ